MTGTPFDGRLPSSTATPDEIYEALYLRHGREDPVRDERRQPRMPWQARLTLWVKDRRDSWDTPRVLTVITCDISRGGFSFLYDQFLHTETVACTQFDSLPGRPIVTGVVANCVHLGGRQHRVGVRFVEVDASDE